MENEQEQPTFSKRASYAAVAGTVAGTAGLAVVAPSVVLAGMGSVAASAAVFVTPVWRFIKKVNALYNDTGHYLHTDVARLKKRFSKKPNVADAGAAQTGNDAAYAPAFSRVAAYGALAATGLASCGLLLYAPAALAAAFGAVAVSGASFTKPVIDLVNKVNVLYVDAYNYLKGDLSKSKGIKINLPAQPQEKHEIDNSIYAPVSPAQDRRTWTKFQAYATLALGAAAIGVLAVHAPTVLVAALGNIIGDAVSYTHPALRFVKKINGVYERAETQVTQDFQLKDDEVRQAPSTLPLKHLKITRPVAYALMGACAVGFAAAVVYAPALLAAAIGSIAGSASSFTSPVLKKVEKVNDFYIDASAHIKHDWQRVFKPKALDVAPKTTTTEKDNGAKQAFNAVSPPEQQSVSERLPLIKSILRHFNIQALPPQRENAQDKQRENAQDKQRENTVDNDNVAVAAGTPVKRKIKSPVQKR